MSEMIDWLKNYLQTAPAGEVEKEWAEVQREHPEGVNAVKFAEFLGYTPQLDTTRRPFYKDMQWYSKRSDLNSLFKHIGAFREQEVRIQSIFKKRSKK